MASKNVETVRAAHESWSLRDFQGVVRDSTEGLVYTNPKYIDAGDVVVTQFTVEGTNDGPLGSLPLSGRRISLQFCEVCQLNKQGRIASGGCYYDQYTLLAQLGHIQPLAAAA